MLDVEHEYELKALPNPGVYAVKVSDDKTLQTSTLVIASDMDAFVKLSADQLLVYAQDMKTGKGRPQARVLISNDKSVFLDAKTGGDGVLLRPWNKAAGEAASGRMGVLVLDGPHVAACSLDVPESAARPLAPTSAIVTDRSIYKPGELVRFRAIVRDVLVGRFVVDANTVYQVFMTDSRGRRLYSKSTSTGEFGTLHDEFKLPEFSSLGTYSVEVRRKDVILSSRTFDVRSVEPSAYSLRIAFDHDVLGRGEILLGKAILLDELGSPAAGANVEIRLPSGVQTTLQADALGTVAFSYDTALESDSRVLEVTARVAELGLETRAKAILAPSEYDLRISVPRRVFAAGEWVPIDVELDSRRGFPVNGTVVLSLEPIGSSSDAEPEADDEVVSTSVAIDPISRKAKAAIRLPQKAAKSYHVRASAEDRFGNRITELLLIQVSQSGPNDGPVLRFISDVRGFRSGETAKVLLRNMGPSTTAILTWETDRILSYQLVTIPKGDGPIEWTASAEQSPAARLGVARMLDSSFATARLDFEVERRLDVSLKAAKTLAKPGEEIEIELSALDVLGKPVRAELAASMSNAAYLTAEIEPTLQSRFNQMRRQAFSQTATNLFRYQPYARRVSREVLGEQARQEEKTRDALSEDAVKMLANDEVSFAAPELAPKSKLRAGGVGGGMGGGGGGGGMAGMGGRPFAGRMNKNALKEFRFMTNVADGDMKSPRGEGRSGGGQIPFSSPRSAFVTSAYWNPGVVTNNDGKAKLRIRMPETPGSYRLAAWGASAQDALLGQATLELKVEGDWTVAISTPDRFVEGDRTNVSVKLSNRKGRAGRAKVQLQIEAGGRTTVDAKEVDVPATGAASTSFGPIDVPRAEQIKITAKATMDDLSDAVVLTSPIKPWGVPIVATASGVSTADVLRTLALPEGGDYANAKMSVIISPLASRVFVDAALDSNSFSGSSRPTILDVASDLLAALSARKAVDKAPNEALAVLSDRVEKLVRELALAQNQDGGWPIVRSPSFSNPSDPHSTIRTYEALALARSQSAVSDPHLFETAIAYLSGEFAKLDVGDFEAKAQLLAILTAEGKSGFEQANALNRSRDSLSSSALAKLALAFKSLDRQALAEECLDVLRKRAHHERADLQNLNSWSDDGKPESAGSVETTALALLAFTRVKPDEQLTRSTRDWLLSHRSGGGWLPHSVNGRVVQALAESALGEALEADRYTLIVGVDNRQIASFESKPGARTLVLDALDAAPLSRVSLHLEGNGTFAYSIVLSALDRNLNRRPLVQGLDAVVKRRLYSACPPLLDGLPLPSGFSNSPSSTPFENTVSEVPVGARVRVRLELEPTAQPSDRNHPNGGPIVVVDAVPAGFTLLSRSILSNALDVQTLQGELRFYYPPGSKLEPIEYEIEAVRQGAYRCPPVRIESVIDPSKLYVGEAAELTVLASGAVSKDKYRATPDELLERGRRSNAKGSLVEAEAAFEELMGSFALDDKSAVEISHALFRIAVSRNEPNKIVKYFEVFKEKAPETLVSFAEAEKLGEAYRAIGESERACLVWRALVEGRYQRESLAIQALASQGLTLESVAAGLALWKEYPGEASIAGDLLAQAHVLASIAGKATADDATIRQLNLAQLDRSRLLLQALRLNQAFLSQSPTSPLADEAGLALIGVFLELGDEQAVVELSERCAKLYPLSPFFDGFQYSQALALYRQAKYDSAITIANKLVVSTRKGPNGEDLPSRYKEQALYIMGQVYEMKNQFAEAARLYKQVIDRFPDAAVAYAEITRRELKLPEVAVVDPAL